MSESLLIAIIGLAGAVLAGLIGAFGAIAAVEIKTKAGEKTAGGCGVIGLAASAMAAVGLVVGLLLGVSIVQNLGLTTTPPSVNVQPSATQVVIEATATPSNNAAQPTTMTLNQPTMTPILTRVPPTKALLPTVIPTRARTISDFIVAANVEKNPTMLKVSAGEKIYVEYKYGQWTGDSGKQGMDIGCGFFWNDTDPSHKYPIDNKQNAGAALIGYIGSEPFLIGCQPHTELAVISGDLYLGMNDCQGCYWDNAGEIHVRVEIR